MDVQAIQRVPPQVIRPTVSQRVKEITKKIKEFMEVFWEIIENAFKSIGKVFKIINATPVMASLKEGLGKVVTVLDVFSIFTLIKDVKELPSKIDKIVENIDDKGKVKEKKKSNLAWAIADVASAGFGILKEFFSTLGFLSKIGLIAEIPGLNFIVTPLSVIGLGYSTVKNVNNIFHSVKFLREVKKGKSLNDYNFTVLDKAKFERNTDKKVVQIIEDLKHVDENTKKEKVKSILHRKIALGIVDSILNVAMIVSLIAGLFFGLPLLVLPIIALAKSAFSIIKRAINLSYDEGFKQWFKEKQVQPVSV